ncbi:alpha/beta fold hydrolase [Paracoccus aminovorans]|uniref:alpha/beta fold hydrolase n=1 Tax=Paracoccus aminovorans TaxID=34004 RepID=UPI002B25CF8A|nr:hypothetical protein [Paracoccus aminovorans]
MREIQTIYEDDLLKVSFSSGTSDKAVVSFSGIGLKIGGMQQEEFRASIPGDFNIYFCIEKSRSWFNDSFTKLVELLGAEITQRGFTQVTTLGNSMGGFGALLFARYLPNCRRSLAFVPQTSIRSNIAGFEKRYLHFAERVLNWAVPDVIDHLEEGVEYNVLVGDTCIQDNAHVGRLMDAGIDSLKVFTFPGCGHDLARDLKQAGLSLGKIIQTAIEDINGLSVFIQELAKKRAEPKNIMQHHHIPYRNDIEIQLFGLQRSGNHAVIAWILQQFDEPTVFLNNVAHFSDPYLNWRSGPVAGMEQISKLNSGRIEELRARQKHLLVYSYENLKLSELAWRPLVPDPEQQIGRSRHIRRVLLLRDFFNWVASRIRLMEYRQQDISATVANLNPTINLWLGYVREFLGETDYLGAEDVVRISYPRWIGDREYRAYLLGRMSLPLSNNDNDKVPDVGGGSSFDKTSFTGAASNMRIGERWHYLRDARFSAARAAILNRREEIEAYNYQAFDINWPDLQA